MGLYGTSFVIQEFVPPETYKKWGDRSIWFIDEHVVRFAQWLKDECDGTSVTINNWKWDGPRRDSGYRPPINRNSKYAKESSHRRGLAIDVVVKGYTPDQIRTIIDNNYEYLRKTFGVTGYEVDTPTWTHVDFRPTGKEKLYKIPYKRK